MQLTDLELASCDGDVAITITELRRQRRQPDNSAINRLIAAWGPEGPNVWVPASKGPSPGTLISIVLLPCNLAITRVNCSVGTLTSNVAINISGVFRGVHVA